MVGSVPPKVVQAVQADLIFHRCEYYDIKYTQVCYLAFFLFSITPTDSRSEQQHLCRNKSEKRSDH